MVPWVATIGVVTGLVLLVGLFEPIRMWIGWWPESSENKHSRSPFQTQLSHNASDTEVDETMSRHQSRTMETAIETAFGNTVGVFDDFHAIDRELSNLSRESQRMLQAIESPQANYSHAAFPTDPMDPEVTRLKEDTKRLEFELKP